MFLQNNDNTGLILTSKRLLGTENFLQGRDVSMYIALSEKNKLKIANGTYVDSELFPPLRERVNDMLISWIMNTVHDSIS